MRLTSYLHDRSRGNKTIATTKKSAYLPPDRKMLKLRGQSIAMLPMPHVSPALLMSPMVCYSAMWRSDCYRYAIFPNFYGISYGWRGDRLQRSLFGNWILFKWPGSLVGAGPLGMYNYEVVVEEDHIIQQRQQFWQSCRGKKVLSFCGLLRCEQVHHHFDGCKS